MPPDEQMSNAETGRHLGRIELAVTKGFAEVKSDLDKYVLLSVHEAEMRGIESRFRDIEKEVEQAQARQRAALALVLSSLIGVAALGVALFNALY